MKRLAILGSTGSIGCSALSVVDAHPDRLQVVTLAAGGNAVKFAEQIERYRPQAIAMASAAALDELERVLPSIRERPEIAGSGSAALTAIATHPAVDVVLCATSGIAALDAVLAAIRAGKTIALANKEVLVMAGSLVTATARAHGVAILPVDSEHSAIHQCLQGRGSDEVKRIILTASGGPFRDRSVMSLETVSREEALRHPTWKMGPKITIDSATMMNKGLEVIEARWLFDLRPDQIDVIIHPQSIVHSLVELSDGSLIAQLGPTDMRLPIQYAFSYPKRWAAPVPQLSLSRCGPLEFLDPEPARFPCLGLAYRALRGGDALAVALNAANEVAVASFLHGALPYMGIPNVIEATLDRCDSTYLADLSSLDEIRDVDGWARAYSRERVGEVRTTR